MRTTTASTFLLASMLSIGCAPIGSAPGHGRNSGPDAGAGSADPTCDESKIAQKSGDIDFTGAAVTGLPDACWTLTGKLTVDSSVTSLAKLGDLRGVKDLVITNSQLTTIDTPSPLAVSGTIDIESNTKLEDLSNLSLPSDASCGTYLTAVTLKGNTTLTTMGALNQVRCVVGAVDIENNVRLTDVDLSNAVRIEGGLTIQGDTAATTIELDALQSVTGVVGATGGAPVAITIANNTSLTSLGTWSAIQFMHGGITIDTNPALTSLAGVITAGTNSNNTVGTGFMVEGTLAITNNAKLTEVGDFDHLSWAQQINVSHNASLDYCEAREIGCCVVDSQPTATAMDQIASNKTTSCGGASSWCYNATGACHNNYTGYSGPTPR
jgi:hypothetical protein